MRAWIALVLLAGCKHGTGSATIANLHVDPCYQTSVLDAASFDLHPDYFVADMLYAGVNDAHPQNRLIIRVQSSGHRIDEADGIFFNAADSRLMADQLNSDMVIGPTSNLRATLLLNATCPQHPVDMELDGTVHFTKFGSATGGGNPADFKIVYGDELQATFSLNLFDRRQSTLGGVGSVPTTASIGGTLMGDFDFTVRPGSGAQAHP